MADRLTTVTTESRGTGIVSRDYQPKGFHVIQCEPYCHSIGSATHRRYCASCFSDLSGVKPLRCSQCKFNRYCGRKCQQNDWLMHKGECPGMAAIHPHLPSDTMRFVLRLLAKIRLEKATEPGEYPGVIDQLCSNKDRIPEKKRTYFLQQMEGIERLSQHSKAIALPSKEMLYELLCKLSCNTFSILDDSLNSLGEGLYSMASWINHQCQPNCVVVFEGLTLHLHTLQNMLMDGSCELYISYVDLLDPRSKRQEALLSGWYFTCQCSRCTEESSIDHLLTSLKCPRCSKPVLESASQWKHHNVSPCKCEGLVMTERQKEAEDSELILRTAQRMKDEGDYTSLLTHCQKMQPVLDGLLSGYHYVQIRMLEHMMDAAIELEQWELAFTKGKSLIPLYRLFLGTSPVTSVHLLKVAKLGRLLDGEGLRESYSLLQEAATDLLVTHGEKHHLTRLARDLLLMGQPFKAIL